MNFSVSLANFSNSSAVVTVLFPSLVFPASVTQPKKVFPWAVGAVANSSPVPAWTLSPVNPLATYPSSSRYFTLSGTILTSFFLSPSNAPSVASNKTLVLTLVSTSSEPKDDPSEALK